MMATGYLDGPSALEKLIFDCEYENQQYVKLIEHESSILSKIKTETEWKRSETQRLEEANSQLDTEVKQIHGQFVQNRENAESQKRTGHILSEQIAAVTKKLESLTIKKDNERSEQTRILQHYKDICEKYREKYESFPNAKGLKVARAKEEELKKLTEEKKENIARMRETMQFHYSQQEGRTMNKDEKDFIIKLAEARLENLKLFNEIASKKQELKQLKQSKSQPPDSISRTSHKVVSGQVNREEETCQENTTLSEVMDSPMISVFSEREETEENMQPGLVPPVVIHVPQAEQADPPPSWLSNFQKLQVKQNEEISPPPVSQPSSVPQARLSSKSPEPPFVAYRKTALQNNHAEESVRVHLHRTSLSAECKSAYQKKPDANSCVGPVLETVKRTLQQPSSIGVTTSNCTTQNTDHASSELFSQRPKIPKLDLKSPTSVKTPSSQANFSRYRNQIPMVQMPRMNNPSVRHITPKVGFPVSNISSPRIPVSQYVGQQNQRFQMRAVQPLNQSIQNKHHSPQKINYEHQKQQVHQKNSSQIQPIEKGNYTTEGNPNMKFIQDQIQDSLHISQGENPSNEIKPIQRSYPNDQQQHEKVMPSGPVMSSNQQSTAVFQISQSRHQPHHSTTVITANQRPTTSVIQPVVSSPIDVSSHIVSTKPTLKAQASPRQEISSPRSSSVIASQAYRSSPNSEQETMGTARPGVNPDPEIRNKMLGPSEPYYLKLKDVSAEQQERSDDDNSTSYNALSEANSPVVSTQGTEESQLDAVSPFNMQKHKQRLAALNSSPGCPMYTAFHYKKSTAQKADNSDADEKHTEKKVNPSEPQEDGPTFNIFSAFGSSKSQGLQSSFGGGDASDNAESSFNLFGQPTEDKPAESFDFFGTSKPCSESNNSFGFNFGASSVESSNTSSNHLLSLFGESGGEEKDNGSMGGFSFSFGAPAAASPDKPFSLF